MVGVFGSTSVWFDFEEVVSAMERQDVEMKSHKYLTHIFVTLIFPFQFQYAFAFLQWLIGKLFIDFYVLFE